MMSDRKEETPLVTSSQDLPVIFKLVLKFREAEHFGYGHLYVGTAHMRITSCPLLRKQCEHTGHFRHKSPKSETLKEKNRGQDVWFVCLPERFAGKDQQDKPSCMSVQSLWIMLPYRQHKVSWGITPRHLSLFDWISRQANYQGNVFLSHGGEKEKQSRSTFLFLLLEQQQSTQQLFSMAGCRKICLIWLIGPLTLF